MSYPLRGLMADPQPASDADERRRRLERESERLGQLIESLDRSRQHAPWYLLASLLAVPGYFLGGIWLALAAIFCAVVLSLMVLYLAGVRQNEYRGELEDVQRSLDRLRRRDVS